MMAGLPLSLIIAISLTAGLWAVAAVTYYFDYSAELIWVTLLFGSLAAVTEWRVRTNLGRRHD